MLDIPGDCVPEPDEVAAFAGRCKQQVKSDRGTGWKRFTYEPKKSFV
jgi:hypothetical protein